MHLLTYLPAAGCPSCHPTNSIKAPNGKKNKLLKSIKQKYTVIIYQKEHKKYNHNKKLRKDLNWLTVIGGKQFIESNRQHIDGEGVIQFAAQIEGSASTKHGVVVMQVVNITQQLSDNDHVVERDRHASSSQRVSHVQRIPEAHDATPVDRCWS